MITTAEVACRMGWPTRRARRRLLAADALEKHGGRHVTTLSCLVERFPEVAERFGPLAPSDGLPALLETADVARLTGRPVRWARRWLLREGVGAKRGGRVVATAQRVRDVFGAAPGEAE